MSIFEPEDDSTDFDRWISDAFDRIGAFTALVVLVEIDETKVNPICSTYLNVVGDDVDWAEIIVMFAGAGAAWHAAAFFPETAPNGGPLDNPNARLRLRDLEGRLDENRMLLNEGGFFNAEGQALHIDEIALN